MKATCISVKKTELEALIESGDKTAVSKMIEQKERALANATGNAEYYRSVGNAELADNEQSRANRLVRDLKCLKAAM